MASQKSWGMNIQWLVILVIVDLLLVFQLLPMIHLVIKAFTPDGYFSLVTFRRLYEYKMNWDALTNTVVAGLATMVLGTLIAFPLAWLFACARADGFLRWERIGIAAIFFAAASPPP